MPAIRGPDGKFIAQFSETAEILKTFRDDFNAKLTAMMKGEVVPAIASAMPKDTGDMARSVRYNSYIKSWGGALHADSPAWFLENGTVHMSARPTLTPVLRAMSGRILAALGDTWQGGTTVSGGGMTVPIFHRD